MELWITAIGTIGFPSCIALYLLMKRETDKKEYIDILNQKDEQNRIDTKAQLEEMRAMNKEEKEMFKGALDSFKASVDEFQRIGKEMVTIKEEVREMTKDISIIKDRMSK